MKPRSEASLARVAKNVGADVALGVAMLNGQRVPVRNPAPNKKLAALLGCLKLKEK